jgi:hypothetical protein
MIWCLDIGSCTIPAGLCRRFFRRGHVRRVADWKLRDTALWMVAFSINRRKQSKEVRIFHALTLTVYLYRSGKNKLIYMVLLDLTRYKFMDVP